jgi:hypothetical protein
MKKKEYDLLASFMCRTLPADPQGPEYDLWLHMLNVLSNELSMTNPCFDYQRFRRACFGEPK